MLRVRSARCLSGKYFLLGMKALATIDSSTPSSAFRAMCCFSPRIPASKRALGVVRWSRGLLVCAIGSCGPTRAEGGGVARELDEDEEHEGEQHGHQRDHALRW